MHAVAVTGKALLLLQRLAHVFLREVLRRLLARLHQVLGVKEHAHGGLNRRPVVLVDGKHSRRQRPVQRRARGCRNARGLRRRRRYAVVNAREQHRVKEPLLGWRGQVAVEEQEDAPREAHMPHQRVNAVSAHTDLVWLDARYRRFPGFIAHSFSNPASACAALAGSL